MKVDCVVRAQRFVLLQTKEQRNYGSYNHCPQYRFYKKHSERPEGLKNLRRDHRELLELHVGVF